MLYSGTLLFNNVKVTMKKLAWFRTHKSNFDLTGSFVELCLVLTLFSEFLKETFLLELKTVMKTI